MIIEVENLVKNYGEVNAVNGISFTVNEGALFSFLGTNGAGKSTTINVLTTLIKKTSGNVFIDGINIEKSPEKIRKLIGIVFQDSVLDGNLTVYENLCVRASLYPEIADIKSTAKHALKLTGIDYGNRRYKTLSGGQRRRADIARALLHTPKILFLDEPTTGLDPKTRGDIWELIRNLQKTNNTTVFLTTHYMEEAADSDNIIIINKGEIRAEGTPVKLKEEYCKDRLRVTFKTGEILKKELAKTTDAIPFLLENKDKIENVEIINGTLDDVFLNLTGGLTDVN
ncbi:MAG: ABC transporter ATP-binding protein [Ruminococcus sp.]|jgi:multidrug/hemolysin transport system ATP-binding protein|nr:ABC transporter ATP-binding protein [Ruminococcus sp.]